MNEAEWQTRKQLIDTRLRAIQPAWKIIRYYDGLDLSSLDGVAVQELPTASGPADYGLFVSGKFLGVIEAKKVTVNPQNVLEQAKRLLRIDKDMNADARTLFAAWITEGDMGRFVKELPQKLKQDFAGTMNLLRNPDFQKLLLEYPRAKRTFLTTIEEYDVVTSQKLERYGKFDNAEDYLDAFSVFVKANADKVAALSVLLQHPKDWRPTVMDELKRTMNQNGFEPDKLQRAHRVKGFKALADVISMVKHAAAQQAPLLTAEERVNRAVDKLIENHPFTTEQKQWLSLVREHLVRNLSMDEEDFDLTPLLEMRGGKAKVRKVFGDLPSLVSALNQAVAA